MPRSRRQCLSRINPSLGHAKNTLPDTTARINIGLNRIIHGLEQRHRATNSVDFDDVLFRLALVSVSIQYAINSSVMER